MASPEGFLLVVLGLPGAVWPYRVALFQERMDSIGSKRSWSEVEPADWKVAFTRIFGVGVSLVGLFPAFAG